MLDIITLLGFIPKENATKTYTKQYQTHNNYLIEIDTASKYINFGTKIFFNDTQKSIQNFTKPEDLVVLECVDRLLEKGYAPQNIVLEKVYPSGHGTSGRLDILVTDDSDSAYMMIECKTWGKEYDKASAKLQKDGGQLFTYFQQDKDAEILVLYTSKIEKNSIVYKNEIIKIEEEYRNTSNVKDLYERWSKISKSNGLFDAWVKPYFYESKALTPKDLVDITAEDSSKIFNRFMEILRHNVVSDKPNAFSKIFTLFLCKIMDEKITKPTQELGFQWFEGIDTHVSFQKRLTDLYQKGMKEFLDKEVTDLSDNEFEEKFGTLDNTLKQQLLDEFTKIRLQKNNEFAIKDVFDQDTFDENAIVVKEVVELLQGYKIRYTKKQQFLSDFFELLLTTGLKQEVGQFFTPVPIAKFIIRSMPFDKVIADKLEAGVKNELLPNVIDYAVGSGHFITEAMDEIQKNINTIAADTYISDTARKLKSWKEDHFDWAYDYVYGIEKDYRLVKTAKVGCYLHGDGLAKVIHGDGLSNFTHTKEYKGKLAQKDKNYPQDNKQFDMVLSNPPYSVSAFKNIAKTYNEEDFELYSKLTDQSSEIEALFIERTKQLLKDGGMAGIILPSSILNNAGIYTKAREMILKYFDIVAITELGSNTFMATGTNTVIFFLRRKNNMLHKNIETSIAKLIEGRQDITINGIENPLSKYLSHVWDGISVEAYWTLWDETPMQSIIQHEMMQSYMKKLKGSADEQLEQVRTIEKEKLCYFIMAYTQKVTVVKTGEKKAEKKFLGYEFSSRRGSEGIHPTQRGKSIDECTTLYDESSYTNALKANSYIYAAFDSEYKQIDESLKENISHVELVDMMRFDRVEFEKNISLSVKKKFKIESRWEVVNIGSIAQSQYGYTTKAIDNGKYRYLRITDIDNNGNIKTDDIVYCNPSKEVVDKYKLHNNDIVIARSGSVGRSSLYNNVKVENSIFASYLIRFISDMDRILPKYLYYFTKSKDYWEQVHRETITTAQPNLNAEKIKKFKIPLPPKNIQEKIIEEIELLEENEAKYLEEIDYFRDEISTILSNNTSHAKIQKTLGEICIMKAGIFVSAYDISDNNKKDLYPCYGGNGLRGYTKTFTHEGIFSLIGRQGALCGNVHRVSGKFHATEHAIVVTPHEKIDSSWLDLMLKTLNLNQYATGTAQPGLSVTNLKNVTIIVPSYDEQKRVSNEIETIEQKIAHNEQELQAIPGKKEAVLKKYL